MWQMLVAHRGIKLSAPQDLLGLDKHSAQRTAWPFASRALTCPPALCSAHRPLGSGPPPVAVIMHTIAVDKLIHNKLEVVIILVFYSGVFTWKDQAKPALVKADNMCTSLLTEVVNTPVAPTGC